MTKIQSITVHDIPTIQALVDRCRPYVVPHVAYNYWMLANYSSEYTLLAFEGERAIGFVSGFPIEGCSNRMFVIQICVDPDYRDCGLASKLLDELFERHSSDGSFVIECTINPDNEASSRTFSKFAERHGGTYRWVDKFYESDIPERGFRVEIQ